MKKIIIPLGLVISICLLSIGIFGFTMNYLSNDNNAISNNDNIEDIKLKIVQGLNELKNTQNLTWSMNLVTEKEEENVSSVVKMNLETNESEVSMTMAGQEFVHSYSVLEEQQLVSYTYTPMLGDKWVRAVDNESTTSYDRSYLDIIANNIETITTATDNLYQVVIPKEQAKTLLANSKDDSEESTTDEIIADIPVRIIINNSAVETIQIDFSNCIKRESIVVTKYTLTNSYKDIGTTVITVPDDVKNNAVSSEELF